MDMQNAKRIKVYHQSNISSNELINIINELDNKLNHINCQFEYCIKG